MSGSFGVPSGRRQVSTPDLTSKRQPEDRVVMFVQEHEIEVSAAAVRAVACNKRRRGGVSPYEVERRRRRRS
jgi:hypothetical protein